MKKVLALLLAAVIMTAFSVGALADDEGIEAQAEVPIRVDGMAPGNLIGHKKNEFSTTYYINGNFNSQGFSYVSDYPITTIHFGNSELEAIFDEEDIYVIVSLADPSKYEQGIFKFITIEDIMIISLENGKEYKFPFRINFDGISEKISLKITDETGENISNQYLYMSYNNYYKVKDYPLPAGESMTFTVEVLDAAKISHPPYHIQLSANGDNYKVSEVTMSENGTKGQFTVSHLDASTLGDDLSLSISVWDESPNGNDDTSCDGRIYITTEKISTNPSNPSNPSKDPDKTPAVPEATNNPANDDRTIADLASGEDTEVKLSNGSAGLSADTINALGGHGSRLTILNGGMSVRFPGGFNKVTEPGRIYYPFDYEEAPRYASEMLSAVKGVGIKSEARKVGGSMTLPGTASVTLKTKLEGPVNVYLYDEDTGRYTLLASPAAKDGTVTFPTNRMGYMVLTTGRV